MPRYIALLGGMNVGGHRVKMDELCRLFERLALTNVSSFLASGNILFDTRSTARSALESRLENHLGQSLGYAVPTFLRTTDEIVSAVDRAPEAGERTLHVCFLRHALDPAAAAAILSFRTEVDDFVMDGAELYWLCRGKVSDSLVNWRAVAKRVQVTSTARNITMLRKLRERL